MNGIYSLFNVFFYLVSEIKWLLGLGEYVSIHNLMILLSKLEAVLPNSGHWGCYNMIV